mmetsp:Transcript_47825/g.126663  ORF Transcript_47825/g.126663 Transcript_47825/m.126663 type:complete len:333 (-) Transcript_47825:896-1894(-)
MGPAAFDVHFGLGDVPLLDPFFHGARQFFLGRNPPLGDSVDHNRPLGVLVDLDCLLPRRRRERGPGRQSLGCAQHVNEGVLIQLEHVTAHGVRVPRHSIQGVKEVVQRPRGNPGLLRGAVHGVGFPSPRLAVGKDSHVVPIDRALDHVLNIPEHVLLLGVRPEHGVEAEGEDLVLGPRGQAVALPLLGHLELEGEAIESARDLVVTPGGLSRNQRPHPAENTDGPLHVLDNVVVFLPLLRLLPVEVLQLPDAGLEPAGVDVPGGERGGPVHEQLLRRRGRRLPLSQLIFTGFLPELVHLCALLLQAFLQLRHGRLALRRCFLGLAVLLPHLF